MRTIPVEVLLSWPTPNYANPATRGNALVIVNSIFITLVICVVSLRLYTRLVVKRWFGSDDIFICLAFVFTIGLTAVVLLANAQYGWNRHIYDIPFNKVEATLKIAMAGKILFTAAATFTRLSLLFFYYRLVSDTSKRWFVWGIHFNIFLTSAIFITFICLSIFQCKPISNYWTFGYTTGTCMDEGAVTLAAGVINCVADMLCTLLPIPMVMKLQMPRRQRIAVAILFSFGFVVTIAGIVRTWFIYKSLIDEYDITWYAYPLWIAAAVEIDLGVICASAPVLRPLLSKLPFSLSTLTTKLSTKLTSSAFPQQSPHSDATSRTYQGTASQNSQHHKSASDLKMRPEHLTIKEDILGESTYPVSPQSPHTQEYELDHWQDVGSGLRNKNLPGTRDSQDAILGSEYYNTNENVHDGTFRTSDVLTSATMKKGELRDARLNRVSTQSSERVGPVPELSLRV